MYSLLDKILKIKSCYEQQDFTKVREKDFGLPAISTQVY
jgi:hypothetical protein